MRKPFTIKISPAEKQLLDKAKGKQSLGGFIRTQAVEAAKARLGR